MIKERNSGVSRGFAFIDFPSVVRISVFIVELYTAVGSPLQAKVYFFFSSKGAAQVMMDQIGDDGLVVGGRKVFFEYRSVLRS